MLSKGSHLRGAAVPLPGVRRSRIPWIGGVARLVRCLVLGRGETRCTLLYRRFWGSGSVESSMLKRSDIKSEQYITRLIFDIDV